MATLQRRPGRISRIVQRGKRSRVIDAVDLGCGPVMEDLGRFAKKPGRRLQGVDFYFAGGFFPARKPFSVKGKSDVRVFPELIEKRLKKYRRNSVRHFRMKIVISSCGSWAREEFRSVWGPVFRHIQRALARNGRFRIVDNEATVDMANELLKEIGFETYKRRAELGELTTAWERIYANRRKPESWPYALVAVKRAG
ncbi:MAG: hypothetical protein NT067_02640 [Candidatus Diapherotrites archaeon]|nr:hypothetical protein [Candidatus Diapherotrites archaeon]